MHEMVTNQYVPCFLFSNPLHHLLGHWSQPGNCIVSPICITSKNQLNETDLMSLGPIVPCSGVYAYKTTRCRSILFVLYNFPCEIENGGCHNAPAKNSLQQLILMSLWVSCNRWCSLLGQTVVLDISHNRNKCGTTWIRGTGLLCQHNV